MKNLKLLNVQNISNIEVDCFCQDYDENTYFVSTDKIYCLSKGSKHLTLCAKLEIEVDKSHNVVGIEHLLNTDKLFIASFSGEIYSFDIYNKEVFAVGIVDSGIEGFAWSPDQEFLVLLTGANTLILMTKDFDPITEKSLCPDEFGESKPITVGWGSKETQFHGSEGKEAAQVKQIELKPALLYDDEKPRISWRGDGDYFVTSSIHSTKGYRQLRIWSREAVLQCTGEAKEGLEEPVCWRPIGNLISCSQQNANKHKIIFFEKNGLQHGEFTLPFKPNSHKVTDILWNSDSTILLLVAQSIVDSSVFQVMLWTCGNYHWYLKQNFCLPKMNSPKSLIVKWSFNHPHEVFCLNQTINQYLGLKCAWTISSSTGKCEDDDALVASIDNDSILITPFGKMVIPPPMCAYSFTLPSPIQSICFAPKSPAFCCYLGNFKLAFFERMLTDDIQDSGDCQLKLVAAGGSDFRRKVEPYAFQGIVRLNLNKIVTFEFELSHWTWTSGNKILCISSYSNTDESSCYALIAFELSIKFESEKELNGSVISKLESSVIGMCSNRFGNVVAVQLHSGKILKLVIDETSNKQETSHWLCDDGEPLVVPQPCFTMSIITISGKDHFIGLTERFILYCDKLTVLSNCTSYYIHEKYLLTTTTDHVLKCFLIDYDLPALKTSQILSGIQFQKIEKGARIIIAPPNNTKVILQMPRGNLETIHPRALVLSCVCKHLDRLQFDKGFELAKIHRIDLNILYDHNPKEFLDNVNLFVDQLNSATNINLFLASLKNENICETLYHLAYKGKANPVKFHSVSNKIDVICSMIRDVIEKKNDDRLFLSLIATYAKKSDPELEEALIKLKEMKDSGSKSNQALVDSALNFLLYLVDVNELIDVALGTYNLEITIMVAQKSQKDPKEFLPFYNELQSLEENYKKYKIDMHLQRFKLALQNIYKCEEHFDECLALIRNQRLYTDSLYLFQPSSDQFKVVWEEYGYYLMEKRYYDEAGLAYFRCENYEKALLAYKESLNWQSMLRAAMHLSYSDDKIISLCVETAEKLKNNQKYLDASYLLEHYVKDIEESIVTLVDGCEWNAALLQMSKYRRNDILETHLKPTLLEHITYLCQDLLQLKTDFITHTERLKVVRSQKKMEAELPDVVKHHDEELFSETDSVTDIASSVAESKQLSGSIMTRKSSKSRRKQKLKKYRLKEGSPDEDLAHIAALSEIVTKIDSLKDNFLNTLKTLVHFEFEKEAKYLQYQMCSLISLVESEMPTIWNLPENTSKSDLKFGPDSTANSIMALMQSNKAMPNCVKTDPALIQPLWRKIDLSLQMFKGCTEEDIYKNTHVFTS